MNNVKFKYVNDGCAPKDAKTLDQVLGQRKVLDLPYESLAEMEKSMKAMNLYDLRLLAVKLGLKPTGDKIRITRACSDQFLRLTKTYGVAKTTVKEVIEAKPFDPSKY